MLPLIKAGGALASHGEPRGLDVIADRSALDEVLSLGTHVGRTSENDRRDVALVEILLGANGYLDPSDTQGPTGYYGQRLDQAVRRFQKDNNLQVDGEVGPTGETLHALKEGMSAAVGQQPAAGGDEVDDDDWPEDPPGNPAAALMRKVFTWISGWIAKYQKPPLPPSFYIGGIRG